MELTMPVTAWWKQRHLSYRSVAARSGRTSKMPWRPFNVPTKENRYGYILGTEMVQVVTLRVKVVVKHSPALLPERTGWADATLVVALGLHPNGDTIYYEQNQFNEFCRILQIGRNF
ncbi:MAG: hypothetical protein R2932_46265 [Caldilineaceae bacterium]